MKTVYAFAALLALGACGGGGGGGTTTTGTTPSSPSFAVPVTLTPGNPLPPNVPLAATVNGNATEAVLGQGSGLGTFVGPTPATITASANTSGVPNAGPDSLTLTAGGETVVVDLRTIAAANSVTFDGQSFQIEGYEGAFYIQLEQTAANTPQFASFGGWATTANAPTPSNKVRFGVWADSSDITPASVITSKQTAGTDATYTGKSVGMASQTSSDGSFTRIGVTSSDITVDVTDYSSVAVSSTNTQFDNLANADPVINASSLDFVASGTVTSTGFTASNSGGNVDGQFFGPDAEEAGGVFGFTNSAGTESYGGAFVVKRQ